MTARGDSLAFVGRVILVGAGPGDPDLVTVRGVEALARADIVLFDSLATRELVDLAPPHALRIDVGKRGHEEPTRSQDDVNALLVEHARAGRTVVRLKGGDPFVFGRGGEEASACAAAGIPFEVVPGVTSAIAAPGYAGIPLTDRRHAASFAVVTGHKDPGRAREATRWRELGRAVDTLVILMGMGNLEELLAEILAGGRDAATPAAAVMDGTLGGQRVVTATLESLAARVREAGLGAPGVVVVGEVVGLRETLSWWETKPLFGMRVLVTRAAEQAAELACALRSAGAEPVLLPMIRLVASEEPSDLAALDRAIEGLGDYDGLVFTSSNAVRFLEARARVLGRDFAGLRAQVLCVGPKTGQAALAAGLPVHLVATGRSDAEGLLAQVLESIAAGAGAAVGRRFLLPRSDIGRTLIAEGLRAAGARVDDVVAYRNVRPDVDAAALRADLEGGTLAALTFTSPSTVRNFAALLDEGSRRAVGDCVVAAVGGTTAAALREHGLEADVVPKAPEPRALVEALSAHVAGLRRAERGADESQDPGGSGRRRG